MRRLFIAGLLAIATLPNWSTMAIASTYRAANFGGSLYMTWRFNSEASQVTTPTDEAEYLPIGYACATRDTLTGMAKDARLYRYQVLLKAGTNDELYLQPLRGVEVRSTPQGYLARTVEPPAGETWFSNFEQLDQSSSWFEPDAEPDALGKACVDGGIAAGLQMLERRHGRIQRN